MPWSHSLTRTGTAVNIVIEIKGNFFTHLFLADVACSSRVPDGSDQPGYECAEFAARSLAAGGLFKHMILIFVFLSDLGCIPGLGPLDAQSSYINYAHGNLISVSGLGAALDALGFTRVGTSPSSVQAGCAIAGNGGDGDWSHAGSLKTHIMKSMF